MVSLRPESRAASIAGRPGAPTLIYRWYAVAARRPDRAAQPAREEMMRLFPGAVIVSSVQPPAEGNDMTNVHRASLSTKHASLEAQIAREALSPLPDTMRLAKLKKEKLRLKEQLSA